MPKVDKKPELKKVEKKQKVIVNLLDNAFDIDGVVIPPKGTVKLVDALKDSPRVMRAVESGVLEIR